VSAVPESVAVCVNQPNHHLCGRAQLCATELVGLFEPQAGLRYSKVSPEHPKNPREDGFRAAEYPATAPDGPQLESAKVSDGCSFPPNLAVVLRPRPPPIGVADLAKGFAPGPGDSQDRKGGLHGAGPWTPAPLVPKVSMSFAGGASNALHSARRRSSRPKKRLRGPLSAFPDRADGVGCTKSSHDAWQDDLVSSSSPARRGEICANSRFIAGGVGKCVDRETGLAGFRGSPGFPELCRPKATARATITARFSDRWPLTSDERSSASLPEGRLASLISDCSGGVLHDFRFSDTSMRRSSLGIRWPKDFTPPHTALFASPQASQSRGPTHSSRRRTRARETSVLRLEV
jgi:hypothetical protein